MTLTLTADVWDAVGDEPTVLAIVEGEQRWDNADQHMCYTGRPPADLVAAAGATCPNCDGTSAYIKGTVLVVDGKKMWREPCPNPRCYDGRLAIEVRVPRDHSNGGGVSHETVTAFTRHVLVDDVVPIVHNDNTPPLRNPLLEVWDTGPAALWDETHTSSLLGASHMDALEAAHGLRTTWVGKFAVIGRRAS